MSGFLSGARPAVKQLAVNPDRDATGDFRVSSVNEANLVFVDASADVTYWGGITNGVAVARGGHITLHGTATYFDDMLHALIGQRLESPSSDVVQAIAEGTVDFKKTATLADYVMMNVQLEHKRKNGAAIHPHLHWQQADATMPNWLIQYRYQQQGAVKTTAWTPLRWTVNAFDYVPATTLNQITEFGAIMPPAGDSESDILQVRLLRDTANASGLFAGADALNATASALSFDVHVECDRLGSDSEYS